MSLPRIGIVCFPLREDRPHHSRVLVRDRDNRFAVTESLLRLNYPVLQSPAFLGRFSYGCKQRSGCSLVQQSAQIRVAAFGNSSQCGLATRAKLSGNQPQPRRHLSTILEVACICDSGHSGARKTDSELVAQQQALVNARNGHLADRRRIDQF
jgi:hypothetical protein